MLDHIGDVDLGAVDASFLESLIEDSPCWADKRMALSIFLIAGLLAHKHDRGRRFSFSEDSLGGIFPEIASPAASGRTAEFG